jgi:hypothetical protein
VIVRGNRMPGARRTAGQVLQLARVRTRIGQEERPCRLVPGLRQAAAAGGTLVVGRSGACRPVARADLTCTWRCRSEPSSAGDSPALIHPQDPRLTAVPAVARRRRALGVQHAIRHAA